MKTRVNIRLPDWVHRAAQTEAEQDPIANGEIARVLRRIITDHYKRDVPRGTNEATRGDKLG